MNNLKLDFFLFNLIYCFLLYIMIQYLCIYYFKYYFMKKQITKIKNISIWIIFWVWITLSFWVFAATTNWTLWELFNLLVSWTENWISISSEYRLDWSNIKDETVTSYEILDWTITNDDISSSFIAENSEKLDLIDSSQFLRSDQSDTMNWNLTINGWTYWLKSYWSSYWGYFKDTDGSWYAYVGYSNYWIKAYWNSYWWYFKDLDSTIYGVIWYRSYSLFWNGKIRVTWDIYTGWKKVATEQYVDNNSWNEYTIKVCGTWISTSCTSICPSWYTYVTHVWPTDYDWDGDRYVALCKR